MIAELNPPLRYQGHGIHPWHGISEGYFHSDSAEQAWYTYELTIDLCVCALVCVCLSHSPFIPVVLNLELTIIYLHYVTNQLMEIYFSNSCSFFLLFFPRVPLQSFVKDEVYCSDRPCKGHLELLENHVGVVHAPYQGN